MWPYEEIDIDTGGMEGTLANDGLDIEEIVIRTFGKTLPARPDLSPNHREWTAEQEALHGACQEVRVIAGGMGCYRQLSTFGQSAGFQNVVAKALSDKAVSRPRVHPNSEAGLR
jgi:hypothetical protein